MIRCRNGLGSRGYDLVVTTCDGLPQQPQMSSIVSHVLVTCYCCWRFIPICCRHVSRIMLLCKTAPVNTPAKQLGSTRSPLPWSYQVAPIIIYLWGHDLSTQSLWHIHSSITCCRPCTGYSISKRVRSKPIILMVALHLSSKNQNPQDCVVNVSHNPHIRPVAILPHWIICWFSNTFLYP